MPMHAAATVSLRWLVSISTFVLTLTLTLLLVLTVSATASSASPPSATGATGQTVPQAVVYAASCAAAGTWYLQGGYHLEYTNATYSLDLTIPWNTTQPPWIQLPSSPNMTTSTCIVSLNGTYPFQGHKDAVISFFGNEDNSQPFMNLYDMSSQTWLQNRSTVTVPARNHDQAPVGDPIDGKIYVRGGYRSENASTMDIYDPRTNSFSSLDMPVSAPTNGSLSAGATRVPIAQGYASAWCSQRSSILYFGGRFGNATAFVSPLIFEYIPANNTWAALPTTGKGPTEREDACIATDQTCSKLVVFAGQDSETIFGDIYILDLATMQWAVGPSPSNGRVGMSCTMFDDGFLSWGGASDVFLTTLRGPFPDLFNVTTMKWSTRYKMTDSESPQLTPINGTGKGVTLALVLGLSIGATGLAAMIAGILLYRRERKKAAKHYGRIHGRERDPSEGSSAHGKPVVDTDALAPVEQRTDVAETYLNSGAVTREPDPQSLEEGKRQWQQSLGHKVELCSSSGYDGATAEMDIVSQNKQEDPTFLPQSRIAVGPMPAVCPPASMPGLPSGSPVSLSAVATPSAPIARDADFSTGGVDPYSTNIRALQTPQASPFNPDFQRYTQSSVDDTSP